MMGPDVLTIRTTFSLFLVDILTTSWSQMLFRITQITGNEPSKFVVRFSLLVIYIYLFTGHSLDSLWNQFSTLFPLTSGSLKSKVLCH